MFAVWLAKTQKPVIGAYLKNCHVSIQRNCIVRKLQSNSVMQYIVKIYGKIANIFAVKMPKM